VLVFLPEVFSKFVGKHESEPRDALSISLEAADGPFQ
jgi:hypothetical protein